MDQIAIPDLRGYLTEWSTYLDVLRQHRLLDEGSLIGLARDLRIPVSGLFEGTPGEFVRRGWLTSDGFDHREKTTFHPFRLFPMAQALGKCRLTLAPSIVLNPERLDDHVERIRALLPTPADIEFITGAAVANNRVVDLAILLEPLYWPRIVGSITRPSEITEAQHQTITEEYQSLVRGLLIALDVTVWRDVHQELRISAAEIDRNDDLYLLLRLANRDRRLKLKGELAHALLLRQIAEVVRRGFEEARGVQWAEEDIAFGFWHKGSRTTFYGSERPLDTEMQSVPYLAWHYGLMTGSVVRWYVEGKTEYFAILRIIPDPALLRIELVNLQGEFGGKGALKFEEWLVEDVRLRRFSMISFDTDVSDNFKAVSLQAKADHIVGYISASRPDFEFHNFTLDELVEVAARLDEANDVSGTALRSADWTGIAKGKDFEKHYLSMSDRKPQGLKGKEWGEALATYATEFPLRADTQQERPFWGEIRAAHTAQIAHYDYQKKHLMFDPDTLRSKQRPLVSQEPERAD